jgi:hypothetical protein
MLIDIGSQPLFALTPDCVFCPSEGMYDPSYSSSAKVDVSSPKNNSEPIFTVIYSSS